MDYQRMAAALALMAPMATLGGGAMMPMAPQGPVYHQQGPHQPQKPGRNATKNAKTRAYALIAKKKIGTTTKDDNKAGPEPAAGVPIATAVEMVREAYEAGEQNERKRRRTESPATPPATPAQEDPATPKTPALKKSMERVLMEKQAAAIMAAAKQLDTEEVDPE